MEEKQMRNLKDIARYLVDKHELKTSDAERFVLSMIDVINEGLQRERQVKIKGLGTFKVTSVSSRESVDVNTGERIVIDGRDKISFVPDNSMKELVNRPFSEFETVVVGDGVELEDKPIDGLLDKQSEIVEEQTEKESNKHSSSVTTIRQAEFETTSYKEDVEEEALVPQSSFSLNVPSEVVNIDDEEEDETEQSVPSSGWSPFAIKALIVSAIVLFVLLGGAISYLFMELHRRDMRIEALITLVGKRQAVVHNTQPTAGTKQKENKVGNITPKVKPDDVYAEMNRSDARVRTGAYRIVGVKQVVKDRAGQTLRSISRQQLGPGMECYLEVMNKNKELKEGDVVKIPKLELKRHR